MYNKLILVDRLAKDAELRGKERKLVSIDVVTNNYYKKQNGEVVEETEWTSCIAFGKLGELLMQAKKGDLIVCEGMKKTNVYERDGERHVTVYMQIDKYQRLQYNLRPTPKEVNGEVPDLLGHTKIPPASQN